MSRKRKYGDEFRANAVRRMEGCLNVAALARELGVRRKWLYQWRDEADAAAGEPESHRLRRRVAELERLVGQQAAELDFFRGALRRVEAQRQKSGTAGGAASTRRSR